MRSEIIASAVGLLLLAVGVLWLIQRGENPRSSFANFAEMEAAGMIARGWLPDFLPRSARQIEETHDLDTNKVQATFRYDVHDVQSVEAACRSVSQSDRQTQFKCLLSDGHMATLTLGCDGIAHYSSTPAWCCTWRPGRGAKTLISHCEPKLWR
jgi:hypothetical protein